jgi:hypothetical protein
LTIKDGFSSIIKTYRLTMGGKLYGKIRNTGHKSLGEVSHHFIGVEALPEYGPYTVTEDSLK